MMSSCTVEVSNLSTKATAREIEDFFSYSGQVKNVDLKRSDGEASQLAYVTFVDSIASETAMLLSGSTILDQEVTISMVASPETEGCEMEGVRAAEGEDRTSSPRPSAVSRAQDVVANMLSRGFVLGKDVLKKARSFDEKRKMRSLGDKEDAQGSPSKATTTVSPTATSRAKLVERWNKQVEALNERLQIGQRATRAFAMAQQGVTTAGTAVKNSKWVSVAIARVSRTSSEGASSSEKLSHEQVQLTEMCTLKAEA